MDSTRTQAAILDISRRLRVLEQKAGKVSTDYDADSLASLYVAASKMESPTPTTVSLWEHILLGLTVEGLLDMSQAIGDPFPWKPFLVLLELQKNSGFNVQPQVCHVWGIAQDLLDAMGLSLVRPGDLMGTPILIRKAVQAVVPQT